MFNVGDRVIMQGKKDLVFLIKSMEKNNYYLVGEDYRLTAKAHADELKKAPVKEENDELELIRTNTPLVKGKVLHLDGDQYYLEKSMSTYQKFNIPANGYYIKEGEMKKMVVNLLVKHKPDILVITGHDSLLSTMNNEKYYENSLNFIQAVKNARVYQADKDALVIFAGACQSDYRGLIESGANFASSYMGKNIHVLDPVLVAIQVSQSPVYQFVNVEEIIKNTKSKNNAIGGIDTRGVARKIYMEE